MADLQAVAAPFSNFYGNRRAGSMPSAIEKQRLVLPETSLLGSAIHYHEETMTALRKKGSEG
jgi:hypothetical protein